MGRKEKRRGKRRVKKKGIRAGAEAEAETQVNPTFPNIPEEVVVEILSRLLQAGAVAETQANPSFPNIPEEIVVEILSRLPLRSLPRFTCVSKQWRSLVPDIIAKITGKKKVLVRSILRSDALTFHTIDEESRVEQVRTPLEPIKSTYYPLFFGSCDGLLLIRIGDGLFLWNPVTRYFKKVLSYEPLAGYGFKEVLASGLCYDSSTNEYKAVMALDHHSSVGSFRSKNWRRIQFPYRINIYTLKSGPVVNGNLHWYVSDENPNHSYSSHQILYFNPQTNQFGNLPTPEPRNGSGGNMILGLGVLDGCLSVVRHESPSCYSEADNTVEVLAMKEYGMQESWTKLFSISNLALRSYDKLEPLCYTKDGKALMKDFLMQDYWYTSRSGPSVSVYDPINSLYKRIQVQPNYHRVVNVIMYEESLVTPTDYDWEEEELRGEPSYVEYYSYRPPLKWVKRRNRRWDQLEIEEEDYEQPNTRRNINNNQNVLD